MAVAPLLLDRAVFDEWRLIPLVDANGQETKSTLLVRLRKGEVGPFCLICHLSLVFRAIPLTKCRSP